MARGEIKSLVFAAGVSVSAATPAPSGGGGGGGSAAWNSPDGTGAAFAHENGEKVYLFPDAADVELWLFMRVPESYQSGSQISATVGFYSASTSGTVKFLATTYLVEDESDAISDTTDSHASTNGADTLGSPSNEVRSATLDLTDASGQVNGTAVAAGDLLKVKLTRDYANDTDTAEVRFVPGLTEVAYQ